MSVLRPASALAAVVLLAVGCASPTGTEVSAVVAPHFSHEGLNPGDAIAGASIWLFEDDQIVYESVLEEDGTAVVDPDPGVYDVQVRLDSSSDPLCFWGTTEFGVEFPSTPIDLEVSFVCADTTSTTIPTSTATDPGSSTTLKPTTTSEAVASQIVRVVFAAEDQSDCSNIVIFDRSVPETAEPIETAFQLLVAGPTTEEIDDGAGSFFSDETEGMVRSTQLEDGLLTVDFDDLRPVIPNASTSCGSFSLIAQLNGTAFQFEEVRQATYRIEGSCDAFFNWLQRDCQHYPRP